MAHEILVKKADGAIRDVHSDTSVSLEETLESLETLCDSLCELIEAVQEDIRRQPR